MTDELRMAMFEIDGKVDVPSENPDVKQSGAVVTDPLQAQKHMMATLRKHAETLAEKIERDIRKQMPSYVTVRATVQFEEGSILLVGTVALLSWSGRIVFDAAKEEVERQISGLIKASVQRVLSSFFASQPSVQSVGPMEMTVRASGPSPGSLFTRSREHETNDNATKPAPPAAPARLAQVTGIHVLTVAVIVVCVLQLVLVIDHFFEIRAKPATTLGASVVAPVSEHSEKLLKDEAGRKRE